DRGARAAVRPAGARRRDRRTRRRPGARGPPGRRGSGAHGGAALLAPRARRHPRRPAGAGRMRRGEGTVDQARQRGPLRRTLGLLRPSLPGQRGRLAGGGVLLVLEVLFRVLEPWPTKLVVDAVTRSLGADLAEAGPPASAQLLLAAALATISIIGLRAVC